MKQPLDIEAALKGAKVCTRGGSPARVIGYDEELGGSSLTRYPVVAIIEFHGTKVVGVFRKDGRANDHSLASGEDLMMADDDYLKRLERGGYSRADSHVETAKESEEVRELKAQIKLSNFRHFLACLVAIVLLISQLTYSHTKYVPDKFSTALDWVNLALWGFMLVLSGLELIKNIKRK